MGTPSAGWGEARLQMVHMQPGICLCHQRLPRGAELCIAPASPGEPFNSVQLTTIKPRSALGNPGGVVFLSTSDASTSIQKPKTSKSRSQSAHASSIAQTKGEGSWQAFRSGNAHPEGARGPALPAQRSPQALVGICGHDRRAAPAVLVGAATGHAGLLAHGAPPERAGGRGCLGLAHVFAGGSTLG